MAIPDYYMNLESAQLNGRDGAYSSAALSRSNPVSGADYAAATATKEDTTGDVLPDVNILNDSSAAAAKPAMEQQDFETTAGSDLAQATYHIVTPLTYQDEDGQQEQGPGSCTAFAVNLSDGGQDLVTDAHCLLPDDLNVTDIGQTQVYDSNGSFVGTASPVAGNGYSDLAALQMDGPVLPSPALTLAPDATLTPGDTLAYAGYPNGQSQQAVGNLAYMDEGPYFDATGTNRIQIMTDGTTAGGTSGAPVAPVDGPNAGQVVGILDAGTDGTAVTDGLTLLTPASDIDSFLTPPLGSPQWSTTYTPPATTDTAAQASDAPATTTPAAPVGGTATDTTANNATAATTDPSTTGGYDLASAEMAYNSGTMAPSDTQAVDVAMGDFNAGFV